MMTAANNRRGVTRTAVMMLWGAGWDAQAIAQALGISQQSAWTHLKSNKGYKGMKQTTTTKAKSGKGQQCALPLDIDGLQQCVQALNDIMGVDALVNQEVNGHTWPAAWMFHKIAVRISAPIHLADCQARAADAAAIVAGWVPLTFSADDIDNGEAERILAEVLMRGQPAQVRHLRQTAAAIVERLATMNRFADACRLRDAVERVR
jgi:hypothetical protein